MRVWELAEQLRVPSADILELIKPYDAYVTSHLQSVPRHALDAIRANPPTPKPRPVRPLPPWMTSTAPRPPRPPLGAPAARGAPAPAARQPGPAPAPQPRPPQRRYRRRPGPRPVSYEPPLEELEDDPYSADDPTSELRWEPIWSTRDVAAYYGVQPATVRSWVTRGHLTPCGTDGPSHIFNRADIQTAVTGIARRRRRAAFPVEPSRPEDVDTQARELNDLISRRTSYRWGVPNSTLQRLAAVTPNTTITTAEAAKLTGLSPATIRTWVHRGHLTPANRAPDQPAGQQRFRLQDLQTATNRPTKRPTKRR